VSIVIFWVGTKNELTEVACRARAIWNSHLSEVALNYGFNSGYAANISLDYAIALFYPKRFEN